MFQSLLHLSQFMYSSLSITYPSLLFWLLTRLLMCEYSSGPSQVKLLERASETFALLEVSGRKLTLKPRILH